MVSFLLASTFLLLLVSTQPALAQKVYRIGSLNNAEQFVDSFNGFKRRMAELERV
jgi:hypothetical protein